MRRALAFTGSSVAIYKKRAHYEPHMSAAMDRAAAERRMR
jgi:hypothetical protein